MGIRKGILVSLSLLLFLSFITTSFAETSVLNKTYFVSNAFTDPLSGYDIYNLETYDHQSSYIVVYNKDKKEWLRLPNGYNYIHNVAQFEYPQISIKYNPYGSNYYDASKNTVIKGDQYLKSPNNKWGYSEKTYYQPGYKRKHSLLLKNFTDGSIIERVVSESSFSAYWLADNTILMGKFGEKRKQDVIVIYNPENKTFKEIALGSLYQYSSKNNLILYVKNEPLRKSWILDLKTGKERLIKDENEKHLLFKEEQLEIPKLPKDLDHAKLKIINPVQETKYEHEIRINNIPILVSYIFKKDNKLFIPFDPLNKVLGIKISKQKSPTSFTIFTLSYKTITLQLKDNDFIDFLGTMYISSDVLKSLGFKEYIIKPIGVDPLK